MQGGNIKTKRLAIRHFFSQVTILSGNTSNGTQASDFYLNVNNASSTTNSNITGQVLSSINIFGISNPASWQNTLHTHLKVLVGSFSKVLEGSWVRR